MTEDFNRLLVEQEVHAFFLAVYNLPARTRHAVLVAPIGTGNACRTLPDRGAIAVHTRIAATQNNNPLATQINVLLISKTDAHFMTDIRYKIGQCFVNAGEIFPGEATVD